VTAITVIFGLAYLTYLGATAPEGVSGGETIPLTNLDAQAQAGLTIFTTSVGNCTSCHMIKGVGGNVGPNLTNEGANKEHTKQWQIEHLRNPQSKSPGSIMPSYASLSAQQLNDLATLLTGLGTKYK
jgi:mono/diheme cytochrome c family protein